MAQDITIRSFERAARLDGDMKLKDKGSGRNVVSAKKSLWGRIVSWFKGSMMYIIDTTKIGNPKAYDMSAVVTNNYPDRAD